MYIDRIRTHFRKQWRQVRAAIADHRGATAIEYALIAGGISITIVVVVANIGTAVVALFTTVESAF